MIRTNDLGDVVGIEGVAMSSISTDKVGVLITIPKGVDRVEVISTAKHDGDADTKELPTQLTAADPFALKLIIGPTGILRDVIGAQGTSASANGASGGPGMSLNMTGVPTDATCNVSPAAKRIRIALTAPGSLDKFKKWLKPKQKH
ncbi:MAG: hypothetical protein JSS72_10810 [Armatimonadetes bacterium]|nr:hypothetical protein [Armatimonadota bacterium]